ncbi:MAG: hypothetical protein Q7T33_05815 [Dehalococcoidia bacterium]|nr:hypothetical protein [Dehalococcoidia bacterium]
MPTEQIMSRVRRALLLDQTAFEEARDDDAFTPFALGLAAGAVLIGGLGAFLWAVIVLDSTPDGFFVDAVILGSIFLILLWLAGIAVTYVILTQVYREEIAPDALARVVTLGHLPFAATFLVLIPGIGFGVGVLAVAAMFFYTIYGLRSAYPAVDPFKIMVAVLAGFAVWAMILPLLSGPGDAFTPGVFVFEWTEDVTEDISNGAFFNFDPADFLPPNQ